MTPDTLEGSIHDLTQNILADYTVGRPIDRIEPFNQPDRDVIIALIGKLRRIVFPGYFRDPAYHVYSAAHSCPPSSRTRRTCCKSRLRLPCAAAAV